MYDRQTMDNERESERQLLSLICYPTHKAMIAAHGNEVQFDSGHTRYVKGEHVPIIIHASDVCNMDTWRGFSYWDSNQTERTLIGDHYFKDIYLVFYEFITTHYTSRYRGLNVDCEKKLRKFCMLAIARRLMLEKDGNGTKLPVKFFDSEVEHRVNELLLIQKHYVQENKKAQRMYDHYMKDGDEANAIYVRDRIRMLAKETADTECEEVRNRPYNNELPPSGLPKPFRIR